MTDFDVVVVGGGAAGLNGALMLARSRRSVLVIDAGEPRNAPADRVHGLFARDGVPPAELLEQGQAEVLRYGGEIIEGEVVSLAAGFTVGLAGGRQIRARRLLVTTGLVDELPDVAGLREGWGSTVVHCPYCHGWEVRDRPIGVLATGPMAVHQALLFRQLSDDVMFFAHRQPPLADDLAEQLAARDITLVEGPVAAFGNGEVRLESGSVIPREVVAVASRMVARGGFLAGLGLKPVEHPSGMGEHYPADPTGRSEVPGLFLAGNVTDLSAQVGSAAAGGAMAGAMINADLVAEETREAVAARNA